MQDHGAIDKMLKNCVRVSSTINTQEHMLFDFNESGSETKQMVSTVRIYLRRHLLNG